LRGKRTASLFPLRKVRLSATAIATSFVITRIYEISLGIARSGYVGADNDPKILILWNFHANRHRRTRIPIVDKEPLHRLRWG
jgi:hypothetical protein